jgi:cytochrome c oxidase subunit 3/cytochrome o ubiquinol oxidase subunit 3
LAVVTTGPADHQPLVIEEHAPGGLRALDVRKLGMWTFLGSECVFFGALITTFFVYRPIIFASEPNPHSAEGGLNIPFTGLLAFILLTSSLTMVLGLSAIQRNKRRAGAYWLLATATLGTCFLAGQAIEFTKLAHEGVTLASGPYGQCFLLLTGFHGTHVFIGVLWLLACFARAIRGGFHGGNFVGPEIAGLYWHFVDVVWVVIFTVIYLLPGPTP